MCSREDGLTNSPFVKLFLQPLFALPSVQALMKFVKVLDCENQPITLGSRSLMLLAEAPFAPLR
jgi:hypothetical protein